MFEDKTAQNILQKMLNKVPNTLDKREGSVIYNALAPSAIELQNAYIELDGILSETFADTASRENLIRRAKERGITPDSSTNSISKGEFNIAINIGERFSLDDLNYIVTELISNVDNTYKLKCETTGTKGNTTFGTLIPINNIPGLIKAELTELIVPGEDEEDTELLREKYFANLNRDVFGGNIDDYKEKVGEITGVGGLKVIPHSDGGGTVKLIIIGADFNKISDTFKDELKETIDPIEYEGLGVGLAPIGHVVTVESVKEVIANFNLTITCGVGIVFTDVKESIETTIDNYLLELKKTWKDEEYLVVRISQIESRILTIDGIIDISNTLINGIPSNLTLNKYTIPIRGEIVG